jgi:hypothetical protein
MVLVTAPSDRELMESAEPPRQPLMLAPASDARERARLPKSAPYHDAVAPELADELHLNVGMGLALVGVVEDLPPAAIVDAIARHVDALRAQPPSADEDHSDARLALACAYGHQLCRELGWGWAHVHRTKRPGIVIVSPDTRYVVAPRALLDAALDADERGGAALRAHLELLKHPENLPSARPGVYWRLRS